jgi:type II secretory pathway component PulF
MTNEEQILELLKQNQELLQKTYKSAEKTRKYFLYSGILTILVFVLPLIALAYYLPTFIDEYTKSLGATLPM